MRMLRKFFQGFCILVLLSPVLAAPAQGECVLSKTEAPRHIIGLHLLRPEDPRTWERVAALQPDWVRVELHWNLVEPAEGDFHWQLIDSTLQHAQKSNAKILLLINNMPSWVLHGPRPQSAFQRLLHEFFLRYQGRLQRIQGYEIFNEPNNPGFGWLSTNRSPENNAHIPEQDSAALYASFLQAANEEIRDQHPAALIVSGGLFSRDNAVSYLNRVISLGARDCFDVAGYHPYADADRLLEVQTQLGRAFNKIVWFTEYGTTDNNKRAKILREIFAKKPQLNSLFWFIDRDFGIFTESYGLVDYFGNPKPEYGLFRKLQSSNARKP